MIPKPHIAQWREEAPWTDFAQVEQDLIISRSLVAIFSDKYLSENLAFRGGTALHKLFLNPAPRYSEDIDLVQIKAGPIKPIMERLALVMDFFEENRRTQNRGHGIKALYRFSSEYEGIRMRLKIEINCREHFTVLGWQSLPFRVSNNWFSGACSLTTYSLNELLGTKLRALYQRSKGRDLFDLYYARTHPTLDIDAVLECYKGYMRYSTGAIPSQQQFLNNIEQKETDLEFMGDMEALLRPQVNYAPQKALSWLKTNIIPKM